MKTPQLFSGIPRFHSYFLAESEIHEFLEFLTGKNQAYMKAKQKQLDQVFFPTKKKFEKNFFYLNIVIGGLIVLTGITNLFSTNFAFFTGVLAIILSFYQLMQKYYKEKKKKEEFFEKLNWTPQTIDRLKAKQMGQYITNELYSTHLLQESNQENDNGKDCKSEKSNNKPKDTEQRFKSNKTRRKINLSIEDEKFMKKQKKEIGMHQDLEPRTKILNQNEIKDRFQSSSLIARDQNKKTRRIQSFLED